MRAKKRFVSKRAREAATVAMASLIAGCFSTSSAGEHPVASEGGGPHDAGRVETSAPPRGDARAHTDDAEARDAPAPSDAPTPVPTLPSSLSATGLFTSVETNGTLVLAKGVQQYQPLYPLWSDGCEKTRWIYLPPGEKIDTTDMSHWAFPAGTKFWKEFDLDGQRLETRLVWKYGPGADDVLYVSYWWNPDAGTPNDAEMADPILGEQDINGTTHDIPSQQDCQTCHGSLEEHVLGFGAIELDHTLPGVNINTLIAAGSLTTNPSLADLAIPGDAIAQAALGYLHANCGNCHNDTPGFSGAPPMYLRLSVGTGTVEETDTYTTAVNQLATDFTPDGIAYRIAGQDPTGSCVIYTMEQRLDDGGVPSRYEMPPLASKVVDDAGVATVSAWIETLPEP